MAFSAGEIEAVLRLRDEMSPQVTAAVSKLQSLGKSLQDIGRVAKEAGTTLSTSLSIPLGAAGAAAFKFSTDFDTAMTKVETLSGIARDRVSEMRDEVLKLAGDTGKGPKELAEGLLVVTSTGLRGAEAMQILSNAAKLSAAGLGETKDVARAMTSAMTAYGKENLSAADASNKLFVAVREGGAEASEFAGTLGRVVGIASQVGVSFDEVVAQMATFTRLGVNADEAATALRGILAELLHPTQQTRDAMESLGTSIDEVRKSVQERGLADTLIDLIKISHGNMDAIGALVPNVRALAGVMGTAGSQADAYRDVLAKVRTETGAGEAAFARMTETVGFKWNKFVADASVAAIQLGDSLAGAFQKSLEVGIKFINEFIVPAVKWFANLSETTQLVIFGIAAFGVALGPILYSLGNIISVASLVVRGMNAIAIAAGLTETALTGVALGFAGLASAAIIGGIVLLGKAMYDAAHHGEALAAAAKNVHEPLKSATDAFGNQLISITDVEEKLKKLPGAMESAGYAGRKLTVVTDESGRSIGKVGDKAAEAGTQLGKAGSSIESFSSQLKKTQAAVSALTAQQQGNIEAAIEMGISTEDISKRMHLSAETIDVYKKNLERAKDETEKFGKTTVELMKDAEEAVRRFHQRWQQGAKDSMDKLDTDILKMVTVYTDFFNRNADASKTATDARIAQLERERIATLDTIRGTGVLYDRAREQVNQYYDNEIARSSDRVAALRADYQKLLASSTSTVDEIAKAWEAWYTADRARSAGWVTEWAKTLNQLSGAFERLANVSGGTFSNFVREIASFISAMEIAVTGTEAMHKGIAEIGDGKSAAGIRDLAVGILSVASAFMQATATGSTFSKTIKGALVGAEVGAQLGGGIGAAIGAAFGGLAGLFRGLFGGGKAAQEARELREEMSRTRDVYADLIARANAAGINTQALWNPKNVTEYRAALAEVTAQVEAFETKVREFPSAFQEMLNAGTEANTLLSQSFKDMLARVSETGQFGPDIAKFLQGQSGKIVGGFNALIDGMVGGWNRAKATMLSSGDDIVHEQERAARLSADIQALAEEGLTETEARRLRGLYQTITALREKGTLSEAELVQYRNANDAYEQLIGQTNKLSDRQKVQLRTWIRELGDVDTKISWLTQTQRTATQVLVEAGVDGQNVLDRMGRLAVITFNNAIASGKSFTQALMEMGPGLDQLALALQNTGLHGSATLMKLLQFREFANQNKELIGSIDAVNQMLIGLGNTGQLDQATFNDLITTAEGLFERMVAGGLDSDSALRAMQPTLQTIWQLVTDNGLVVDQGTQSLLDQALAAGLVGDAHRDAMARVVIALESVATRFQEFLAYLERIQRQAGAARGEVEGIGDAVDDIPTDRTVTITTVHRDVNGDPEPSNGRGGSNTSPNDGTNVVSAANEGIFGSPTLAVVGDAQEPEFVLHQSTVEGLSSRGNAQLYAEVAGMRRDLSRLLRGLPNEIVAAILQRG